MFYTSANDEDFGNFTEAHEMGLCSNTRGRHGAPYGRNIDGCTSSRPSFTREDYNDFHPDQAIPTDPNAIAWECQKAYEQVGIVRNVIDLMVDFATAGISITHPDKKQEEFYTNWFNRVKGPEVSERLVHNLLTYGRFIVREEDHIRLTPRVRKDIQNNKTNAKIIKYKKTKQRYIPGGYVALNPCMIDVLGGAMSTLTNEEPVYGIRLPYSLRETIKNPKTAEEKKLVESLPDSYKKPEFDGFVKLNQEGLKVVHYKKDDWQVWSKPIIYSILSDIKLLYKLKLADFSILDSAMDMVRIVKIGDFDNKIMPKPAAFQKLSESFQAQNPGGIRTILWTPDITMEESTLQGFDILGGEKYAATNNSIHAGLGVPPTLTGGNTDTGTTNNLASLKTLIKRLIYVRRKLTEFWLSELEQVRKARGHKICPTLEFDILNLGDEEAEKKIWIDLFDRNVVSQEWLQIKFNADPLVEQARQNKEHRERLDKTRVPRSTPSLHDPELEDKCKKQLVSDGRLDPRALNLTGVEDSDFIDPGAERPSSAPEQKDKDDIPRGDRGGRPPGSTDKEPRKRRGTRPVVRATRIWAASAQKKIGELVNKAILAEYDKKNMRSLSHDEHNMAEKIKCFALFNLTPNTELSVENIRRALESMPDLEKYSEYEGEVSALVAELGRELTIQEQKDLQLDIYMELQR